MPVALDQMAAMQDQDTLRPVSFHQATKVSATDTPTIYEAYIYPDWCFGSVPHGGHLFSIVTKAVRLHCQKNPKTKHLVDSISSNISYLRPTKLGSVQIHVDDLRTSPAFSTYRAALYQEHPPNSGQYTRHCLEAIITQGSVALEQRSKSLTLPPPETSSRSPPPTRDGWGVLELQKTGIPFYRHKPRYQQLFPPNTNLRQQQYEHPIWGPSIRENWFRADENWTPDHLPYLVDLFGPVHMNYAEGSHHWHPTLNISLELKKLPPTDAGWEWLHGRMDLRECRNSRQVLDVVISDEEGEVVALARHVNFLVPMQRYQGAGKTGGKGKGDSKL
ncbi:hypothetical protein BP6252_06832 [Coleophoma cylindrospora]|uniref:Thioesterase-like superfamily-domain-containing protein n=1 Tax=Coleophoma cylindrospora TaxID=1849047 RepID=A0A3D8RFV2_9HELO|nr:hypothetical protein BP6252_06832 [Coleophoma cylindrospora]